jgi:hypothetical protein
MHDNRRPSPRVTFPQKLLMSAAQAPSTVSTAAANRSLRLDCADACEIPQVASMHAAEITAMFDRGWPPVMSALLQEENPVKP